MTKHFKVALFIGIAVSIVMSFVFILTNNQNAKNDYDSNGELKGAWAKSRDLSADENKAYSLIGAFMIGSGCAVIYYIISPDHPVWKRKNRKKHLKISLIIGSIFGSLVAFIMLGSASETRIGFFSAIFIGLTMGLVSSSSYLLTVAGCNIAWEGLKSLWYGGDVPEK